MSKIAMAQATDKETRAMAENDIATQDKHIADLQSWLPTNGKSMCSLSSRRMMARSASEFGRGR